MNMLRPTAGSGFAVYRVDAGLETALVLAVTPQWPGVDRGSHRGGVAES